MIFDLETTKMLIDYTENGFIKPNTPQDIIERLRMIFSKYNSETDVPAIIFPEDPKWLKRYQQKSF